MTRHTYQLAAIDLDGTLLGPDKQIHPANLDALRQLTDDGMEIVLASGRHYHSMLPFVEQLPMVNWVVSVQGGELSNRDRSQVLYQDFLSPESVSRLVQEYRDDDFVVVHYCPDGVYTTSSELEKRERYRRLAGILPKVISESDLATGQVYKSIWLGKAEAISSIRRQHDRGADPDGLLGVQTYDTVYEFMPATTTKAGALQMLCEHLSRNAKTVVAFGDAENDIPMFQWAGRSYGMPHGWPLALSEATHVAPAGDPATAFARAVEMLRADTASIQ